MNSVRRGEREATGDGMPSLDRSRRTPVQGASCDDAGVPESLRIGFLGGVAPALGGGGLERQMRETAAALRTRGHDVQWVERAERGTRFDVVHAFGAEPNVWHALRQASSLPALVVSPVLVVSPGGDELLMRAMARLPLLTAARMRREAVVRADAVVVLTAYERRLMVRALGVDEARVVLIPNGSDVPELPEASPPEDLPADPFALLLGVVSSRKRQAEVVRSLAGVSPVVVAGHFAGTPEERRAWDAAVAQSAATWLGHVADPSTVAALTRAAGVLVHWSAAETQSLAVVEALSVGTAVVLSDIPSHRELAGAFPAFVRIAPAIDEIAPAVRELLSRPPAGSAPPILRWADVAERLEAVYRRVAG
jgi:glycosyltransferase involved in cell wall biosynthesis